jgi:tight adherence protein C
MDALPLIIIILVVLVGGAILAYIGRRAPSSADERLLQERLEEFRQKGEEVNLEKIELSQPFNERILLPVARKVGELVARFTPQNALKSINRKLELAGSPPKLDATVILTAQILIAVVFGGLLLLVFSVAEGAPAGGTALLLILLFTLLGFYFPQLWLSSKIQRRQKDIRKAMPDALDLLTICVEAGLGFDAALSKVSEKWETELSLSFARVIREIALGKVRREALRDLAERTGLPEVTSFVAAVIQSEVLGVSMAKVLRIQSDQMRVKRRQLAEEEAHKAPLKMLLPMAFLIFPSLLIVLMTPAALKLYTSFSGMF